MLASFKDLKRQGGIPISNEMLSYFNSELPDGYAYEVLEGEEHIAVLVPKDDRMIGFKQLKPRWSTDEQRKALQPYLNDQQELLRRLHNMQQPLELDPTGAKVILGISELSAMSVIKKADDNNYAEKCKLRLVPIPDVFDLTFEDMGYVLGIRFRQAPSKNSDVMLFRSTNSALDISIFVDTSRRGIEMKYKFDSTREKSASKCRDAAHILRGMQQGTVEIAQMDHSRLTEEKQDSQYGEFLSDLWDKVVWVEETFDVHFDTRIKMDRASESNVRRLHSCISEGQAVGLGYLPSSITVRTDGMTPLSLPTGKTIFLTSPEVQPIRILDTELQVNSIVGLVGVRLLEPQELSQSVIKYNTEFEGDYQCTILYLRTDKTDNSEENYKTIMDILANKLPDGNHY